MSTVILLRHGRSTANTAKVLAGRTPGVELDATGREQAAAVARELASVGLVQIVSSPVLRCRQTADAVSATTGLAVSEVAGLSECDYGDWSNRPLKELAEEPLWRTVQQRPSAAAFPGGESLRQMSARAVAAIAEVDARITAENGPAAVWLAVSHGDPIKAVLADALGIHLDGFQRINVDPASLSLVSLHEGQSRLVALNRTVGSLVDLIPAAPEAEATVGGSTGAGARG